MVSMDWCRTKTFSSLRNTEISLDSAMLWNWHMKGLEQLTPITHFLKAYIGSHVFSIYYLDCLKQGRGSELQSRGPTALQSFIFSFFQTHMDQLISSLLNPS